MDEKDLFMTPRVTQYGSHMVMTNVQKQIKQKYINVDTRFRDDFQTSNLINYNITLPERITEVKSLTVSNVELPMMYYNISNNLENNVFGIINNNITSIIVIPDGQYDVSGIILAINTAMTNAGISFIKFSTSSNFSVFSNTSTSQNTTIDFSINTKGSKTTSNLKFKLGGVLGFQYAQYFLNTTSSLTSTSIVNLNGPRYLFVILDEFSGNGNQSVFSTQLQNSTLGRNIIARIQIDGITYPFGSILIGNRGGGLLTSSNRGYNGKVDIQRFNIQLVNEIGTVMDLNGQDITLSLVIDYE